MKLFTFSKSYALGLVFIFLVAVIWSGASILVQYIFENFNFRSPFLVTYICNSLFLVYLPLWQIWVHLGYIKDPPKLWKTTKQTLVTDSTDLETSDHSLISENAYDKSSALVSDGVNIPQKITNYTHWDVFRVALIISPLWFISNCLYNYSLYMTSISSSTIISNLSATFTLAFAYFAGLEEITIGKVLGILLCFGGAVIVAFQDDSNSEKGTLEGDVVALFASIGYGVYTTVIRLLIPDDEGISMQLLLGYIGVINAITAFPILISMIWFNLESTAHVTAAVLGFIFLNGFCDNVLSDYLWARAVVLTSPTVASLGTSITIPLAIISDIALGNSEFSSTSFFGAVLVVSGFFLVNIDKEVWNDVCAKRQGYITTDVKEAERTGIE